jgi:hypothetical protein
MAFSEHEIQNFVNSVKQTLTLNGSVSSAIVSKVQSIKLFAPCGTLKLDINCKF